MRARGFTLLEMVIVMVLVGITAVFGSRFIASMASSQVSTVERAQALSGARFVMERLRRELSRAYSPSVYVSEDGNCVSFVPAKAAGTYYGDVRNGSARFMMPITMQDLPLKSTYVAVNASSGEDQWGSYPAVLPEENVAKFNDFDSVASSGTPIDSTDKAGLPFAEAIVAESGDFTFHSNKRRFTLLMVHQVRYCLEQQQITRQQREHEGWSAPIVMLTGVSSRPLFEEYNGSLQLLTLNLTLETRDGPLALPSQLQVNYEP